ncbi:hypothetical protein AXZ77_2109 [Thioclava sp. ES.031]|uniref:DUF1150 family protein n=1 Tax=Thioclava electrotropha TaxID=1549850 RepID=A0ABX6YU80_9RHOB|nr:MULTISPECIES: DUF1150 family protein [Thioclava]MAQ39114.1 DUF1150 domain-containing protein [Thioclava sp.]MPQ93961.1 DUF1150 family protein [Thioclava sp. JE_KL1]OOY05119.1 hypothetical protein BMI87_08870 [Thioclava sp. F28-4]OOY16062.1 hypothetical protein BMI85_11050 [Thioclava sp. DLFJ4-1]OOY20582.1 hypothetical protein BMI86_08585 [Thioclava sp. DLFJ5-1]|tara:strand:+ start:1253 stop:1480 length:228 start_codon:yes stop_codon:yes gene_type:complete
MNTEYDFGDNAEHPIVYVREVAVVDLPEEIRAELDDVDHLYAVHDSDGERLALVKDRKLAFSLARQNDLDPVSVH